MRKVIYCCDVGSVRQGNFGWAKVSQPGKTIYVSSSIDSLLDSIAHDLSYEKGYVALGFECPTFMPVPSLSSELGEGRYGEGNRSMFASGGANVSIIGAQQICWIFSQLSERLGQLAKYTHSLEEWDLESDKNILGWEAFVSGNAHSNSHKLDAASAAKEFFDIYHYKEKNFSYFISHNPFNILNAAVIWSGIDLNCNSLSEEVLLVRPEKEYSGTVEDLD